MAGEGKLKPITKEQLEASAKEVKVEPVVETKPVATATVVEAKPSEVKPEEKGTAAVTEEGKVVEAKKPLKDKLKTFSPKKPEVAAADELSEPIKAKFAEYEKTISQLKTEKKSIDEDDGYQLLVELRKGGKDAIDLIEQSRGEDVSKLTPNQLMELELRKSGVKEAKDIDKDSEETSLEEEMEKFKSLPKTARDREIEGIRQKYDEANKNKTGDLLGKLKAKNQEREQTTQADQIKQREQVIQTSKDWDAYCDSFIGNEHMGIVGTPQMAESLKNVLKDPKGVFLKTDGTLDIDKFFDASVYLLFKDLMLENLENQIGAEKYEQYKSEVEITGGAKNGLIRTPQAGAANDGKPAALKPVSVGNPSIRN